MQTIEALKNKIKNAQDLLDVVHTMKALAAVSIRQYERALEALAAYNRSIEMGLHIVLREQDTLIVRTPPITTPHMGVIVFGTDQGMCGQINERIATYTVNLLNGDVLNGQHVHWTDCTVIAVGERVARFLEDAGLPVERCLTTPSSIAAITSLVQDLLLQIEAWRTEKGVDRVLLCYNQSLAGVRNQPHSVWLLPLDPAWLQRLQKTAWPSRVLPTFTMPAERLFSRLIRQHLFVTLYQACAEALTTENASRLVAMQNAEKNIDEHLAQLRTRFHYQRQQSITAELLDIVAGYEAMS